MISKIIALVIAHTGYQPHEYLIPKEQIEKTGYSVLTVSNKPGIATASDGSTTKIDTTLDKLDITRIDGLFFIGGPGALENLDTNISYQRIQEAAMKHLPLGAICIAPRILAKAGALVAHEATGWNDDNKLEEIFRLHGVIYNDSDVVTDDNCVTASGPHAAEEFALAILELL